MTDAAHVLRTVRASQERLATLVDGYGEAELTGPSYDDDWSVADVLSHLGSQAEIFLLFVDAGINGTEAPTNDAFGPIWDVWNAKSPTAQARDSLAADRALVDRLEALSADELDRFELDMFGMHLDATMLLRMRLGEHALHTWDIAVVADGTAVLPPDATEVLVDGIGTMAARAGHPDPEPQRIAVAAAAPDRRFVLDTGAVSLEAGDPSGPADAEVALSSEALVRLVYGRLDDGHPGVPAPTTDGVDLDRLRAVFPGV